MQRDRYEVYLERKRKEGCFHPFSFLPGSLFLSVIVIFERLDWRQWQKRDGELKVGEMLHLMYSLCILPPHLHHSPSPLLPARGVGALSNSESPWIFLSIFGLSLSFVSSYFSLLLLFLFSDSISGFSSSSTVSLSPSPSLVFRQWNICCLNILPHYLSV